MADVAKAVRTTICESELQIYRNTLYQLGLRARVAKRLRDTEKEKATLDDMAKMEEAIDVLSEELRSVQGEE